MSIEVNGPVLASLREQTTQQGACVRCGVLIQWTNHIVPRPADCQRCHANGRLFDKGCRGCGREKPVPSGWREENWPR